MLDMDYTHITLVVDRSGSIQSIREDVQGAIRQFIKDQKQVPGRATLTIAQFDDEYEIVCENVDLQSFYEEEFEVVPRGMTALLDAWGKSLNSTGEFLAGMPEEKRPGHVIFVVATDGLENKSREFKADQVKEMTERQRNEFNWQIIFLAANQDAIQTGRNLGVDPNAALTYGATSKGAHASYQALGNVVTAVRSGTVNGAHFTDAQRSAAKADTNAP